MVKMKNTTKSNKLINGYITIPVRKFGWGGQSREALDKAFNAKNLGSSLGAIGSSVGTIVNAGIQNSQIEDTSNLEDTIDATKAFQSKSNDFDSLMDEWSSFNPLDKINWKDIRGGSTGQRIGNTISATGSGAATGAQIGGPWGAVIGGLVGLGSSVAGWLSGDNKAKNAAAKLNKQVKEANNHVLDSLNQRAENIDSQNDFTMLSSYMANGGNIYRKPLNRKAAVRNYSLGGPLYTNGANWSNNIITIDNGGTHEENPYEGVQLGIDPQGIPNLVEEGEVLYNDYVFSNRLKVPKSIRKKYKLGKNNISFADAAKKMQKESEERPNDPISQLGLDNAMMVLRQEQETIKQNRNLNTKNNIFWPGGDKYNMPMNTKHADYSTFNPNIFRLNTKLNLVGPTLMQYDLEFPDMDSETPKRDLESSFFANAYKQSPYYQYIQDVPSLRTGSPEKAPTDDVPKKLPTYLRYAPALGNALAVGHSLFSSPDYENADKILKAVNKMHYTPVEFNPIGNYLSYNPLDRNYYINKLNAQAGATRRAIMNTSNPSRNAALLAADFNYQGKLGDLARQAEEYNLEQRQAVEQFNRGTNQLNSEGFLKAAIANQGAKTKYDSLGLEARMAAYQMKEKAKMLNDEAKAANLARLFTSLGNIGKENQAINMRNFEIASGQHGAINEALKKLLGL